MQTKEFTDPDEAMEFCRTLQADNCIKVSQQAGGVFRVNWIANKMQKLASGEEVIDEVWTKEDGTMIVCQDLELEHAKNIIRMILRNEREQRRVQQEMMEALQQAIGQISDAQNSDDEDGQGWSVVTDPEINRVLH